MKKFYNKDEIKISEKSEKIKNRLGIIKFMTRNNYF